MVYDDIPGVMGAPGGPGGLQGDQNANKNIKTHYIVNKLTPNSCDFYQRTFVTNFFRRDLRNFSAEFWRQTPQTE